MVVLLLIFSFVMIMIGLVSEKKQSFIVFIFQLFLIIAPYIILVGTRDLYSGTDSARYAQAYENGLYYRWEVMYVFLMNFIHLAGDSYQVYFFVHSLIEFTLLSVVVIQVSKYGGDKLGMLFLSLFLFSFAVFDLYVNGLRQGFAMTVSLLSLSYMLIGKQKIGLILSAFPMFFHSSYVIYFLLYVFALIVANRGRYILVVMMLLTSFMSVMVIQGFDFQSVFRDLVMSSMNVFGFEKDYLMYSSIVGRNFYALNFLGKVGLFLPIVIVLILSWIWLRFGSGRKPLFYLILALSLIDAYLFMIHVAYSHRYLYIVSPVVFFVVILMFSDQRILFSLRSYLRVIMPALVVMVYVFYLYKIIAVGEVLDFNVL